MSFLEILCDASSLLEVKFTGDEMSLKIPKIQTTHLILSWPFNFSVTAYWKMSLESFSRDDTKAASDQWKEKGKMS